MQESSWIRPSDLIGTHGEGPKLPDMALRQRKLLRRKQLLEDQLLKQRHPAAYRHIQEYVSRRRDTREAKLHQILQEIAQDAELHELRFFVESRVKHFYSIYRKMIAGGKPLSRIYDMLGLRFICNDIESCYRLLEIVHRIRRPVDGRLKDYIAHPKPNGYRSIHTTVSDADGTTLEIQIRTFPMHVVAEVGPAAHPAYKYEE
ncbi:MAG: hypothetical protein ACQETQ_01495 [Spirochaetota bacterium]